jgi:hypothetical protein
VNSPDQPASAPASPPRRVVTPFRIVLGLVLIVAVGAYAYDFAVRSQRQAAFEAASKLLPGEETEKFRDTDISPENMRKVIGRDPVESNKTDDSLEEVYVWQGVLRPHKITVRYTIGFVKGSTPLATSIEPE